MIFACANLVLLKLINVMGRDRARVLCVFVFMRSVRGIGFCEI